MYKEIFCILVSFIHFNHLLITSYLLPIHVNASLTEAVKGVSILLTKLNRMHLAS